MSDRVDEAIDTSPQLETLLSKLREICRQEYLRGTQDALAQIAQIAHRSVYDGQSHQGPKLQRAPRGVSKILVERVLRNGPATVAEIRAAAQNGVERSLSYQTVRLELERGKRDKRYKKQGNKWLLTARG